MSPAVAGEAARIACPDVAPADRRERTLAVPRPRPDVTGPDGRPHVSLGAMQDAIDQRDVVIARKNGVLVRLVDQLDACRGAPSGPTAAPATTPAPSGSDRPGPGEPDPPSGRRMLTLLVTGARH